MKAKNKIVKISKVCHIVAKVLYCISLAVCLILIALAIALPLTNTTGELTAAETAVMFGTLALYAFTCAGLLWNVEGLFKYINKELAPFNDKVCHYLKNIAIFILVLSVIPALLGSILLKALCPETELTFPIELGGIVAGVVLLLVSLFFEYGNELQKQDDETL